MKTWNSFGSEHSANLVIVGTFKETASAKSALDALEGIAKIAGQDLAGADPMMTVYNKFKISDMNEGDLESMNLCHDWKLQGNQIRIHTDETDIQGILKILLTHGARIEVWSAHGDE